MAGFDTSFLARGGLGIQLPDPVDSFAKQLSLSQLVRQDRMAQVQEEERQRALQEQDAFRRALPALLKGNFSRESVQSAIEADPRIGPMAVKEADARQKSEADLAKTRAETTSKETEAKMKIADKLGNEAAWLADHPNLTPAMIANYHKKVASAGLQDVLTTIPMQQWTDVNGAREALKSSGMMFYEIKDRVAHKETNRHNTTTEGLTARGQDMTQSTAMRGQNMTDSRLRESNNIARDAAGVAMVGDPKEIMVDGKPVLAVYDRKSGTFFDANTRQPIKGGIAPKGQDLPGTIVEKLAQNEVTLGKIDRALQLVDEKPQAFGLRNLVGDAVRQRTDPEGVEARALVADIAGQKIHDRSGAAVTIGEMARLKPYIPNVSDDPATVKEKLAMFRREYAAVQQEMSRGRNIAEMIKSGASAAGPAKPKLGEVRDGYRYKGGDPGSQSSWEKASQ